MLIPVILLGFGFFLPSIFVHSVVTLPGFLFFFTFSIFSIFSIFLVILGHFPILLSFSRSLLLSLLLFRAFGLFLRLLLLAEVLHDPLLLEVLALALQFLQPAGQNVLRPSGELLEDVVQGREPVVVDDVEQVLGVAHDFENCAEGFEAHLAQHNVGQVVVDALVVVDGEHIQLLHADYVLNSFEAGGVDGRSQGGQGVLADCVDVGAVLDQESHYFVDYLALRCDDFLALGLSFVVPARMLLGYILGLKSAGVVQRGVPTQVGNVHVRVLFLDQVLHLLERVVVEVDNGVHH